MKKLLFAVAAAALLFSAFLLWENYHLRKERDLYQAGYFMQRLEGDSLKREIDWERWADTVDGGTMARGRRY